MAKWIPLSPKGKGKKAARELKTGKRFCNNGEPKRDSKGKHLKVTVKGKAYRAGYLDAREDIGKARKTIRNRKSIRRRKSSNSKIIKGVYNNRGRVNENLVDDLHGPVVYIDPDFDFR